MFLTVYIASWDEGCRRHILNLEKTELRHKVIDIDKNSDIAVSQGIKAVPTTQIYDGEGNLLGTKWGVATPDILNEWIKDVSKS